MGVIGTIIGIIVLIIIFICIYIGYYVYKFGSGVLSGLDTIGGLFTGGTKARPVSALNWCPADQDKDVGLCYKRCDTNFTGVGPVCWENCPNGMTDIGVS
jgi:hypothetical protein